MARSARLVVVLLLLMPILVFAQPRHARLVTVSYPAADSDAMNTAAKGFTSCGTCQTGDLVYGLVFGQANTDVPIGPPGTPAMGDPGGFDGTWINRFPNLPSQNGYLLRSVSSMSNETQDTPFNVVDGMDATCDTKPFASPHAKTAKPIKSKGIVHIDDSVIGTTMMGKKKVSIDATIKATNPRTVHGEIFQVDLTKGKERIVIVGPGIVSRHATSDGKLTVTVDFDVTDGKAFPPGVYDVRVGTFLPNDFDRVKVKLP